MSSRKTKASRCNGPSRCNGVRWVAAGSLLLVSFAAQAQLAPVAGTHYAGRASETGFGGTVSSGGGYGASVPLDLPGVRGDLPLPLSVSYGGNSVGAGGLGWDVPLSYVFRSRSMAHRRPRPTSLGAAVETPVHYSVMLGGQAIGLIRNADDTAWVGRHTTTRLEVRTDGNDRMVMYDGEGHTYRFSTLGADRVRLFDGDLFLLREITARGSIVRFTYTFGAPTLPGGGSGLSINVASVSYNNHPTTAECFKHKVQLNYDAAATSPLAMFALNGRVLARMNKLSSISVRSKPTCTDSEVALRDYTFTYQADTDTRQPRLRSVTLKGQQSTPERNITLPVATYSYGSIVDPADGTITYEETSNFGPPVDLSTRRHQFGLSFTRAFNSAEPRGPSDMLLDLLTDQAFLDVNGDGRPDFVTSEGQIFLNQPGVGGTTTFGAAMSAPIDMTPKIHSAILGVDRGGAVRVNDIVVNDALRQVIDMNGDGRLDIVETVLPDIDNWIIQLNTPDPADAKKSLFVPIRIPVERMRAALGTTGRSFGRVAMARSTTVPQLGYFYCWMWNSSNWVIVEKRACASPEDPFWKKAITEFELKDINGDGYPDFVYNASFVNTTDPRQPPGSPGTTHNELQSTLVPADMTGSRAVKALINTAGVHLKDGVHLFASAPITLEASTSSGCGMSRWQPDAGNATGGTLNQVCGFQDVNGDGIVDRVRSVIQNGEVVARATLGSASTAQLFLDAVVTLPGPLARTETDLVAIDRNENRIPDGFAPNECVLPNRGTTFDVHVTHGLRDINGDGIPDYIAGQLLDRGPGTWTVSMGTSVGFAPPVTVNSPLGMELTQERNGCAGDVGEAGQVAATASGMYDIDGNGQPELINLNRANPNAPHWEIYQLKAPASQADVGPVAAVPAAGRLTRIDNGYGAVTRIGYKSAKEDLLTAHQIPYPEIVMAAEATTDAAGASLVSTARYAYGDIAMDFDSIGDRFSTTGYHRSVALRGTMSSDANLGIATVTDRNRLRPYNEAHRQADVRYQRAQEAGLAGKETTLSGNVGTDPWALLTVNVSNDTRRIAGTHYLHMAVLNPPGTADPSHEHCVDMVYPYDFAASEREAITSVRGNVCTHIGFVLEQDVRSWRGTPGASEPFESTATVKTLQLLRGADQQGRILEVGHFGDLRRAEDDYCVAIEFADPEDDAPEAQLLSAVSSRTVTDCNREGAPVVLARETWEYDGLPAGQVSQGLVTAQLVERRNDEGTLLTTIRAFDATHDSVGNVTSIATTRNGPGDDGATQSQTMSFDPFGLSLISTQTAAVNGDGTSVPAMTATFDVDPITLDVRGATDPNGTQRGAAYDGFQRPMRSQIKPPGGSTGVLSTTSYLGFAGGDALGRRIVTKVFTDAVAPDVAATAAGRTSTTFFDSLGRSLRSEAQLGADYANATMIVGKRTFDLLGRVSFEADPCPSSQNATTAYGTSYHFNTDGTPSCSIRGRGPQAFSQAVDEATERYPTCLTHAYVDNRLFVDLQDAESLQADTAARRVLRRSIYSAIGQLMTNITLTSFAVHEWMDFDYDRLGRMVRMGRFGDPARVDKEVVTAWKYDSLGQLLELREPAPGAAQRSSYDNWGGSKEVQWTDATVTPSVTRKIRNEYDGLGRLVRTEERNNDVVDTSTVKTYLYDQAVNNATPPVTARNVLGRLAKATSPLSTESFSYDALGRIEAQVFTDANVNPNRVFVEQSLYHGDGSIDRLDLKLPDTTNFQNERVAYAYDSAGRTRQVNYERGGLGRQLFGRSGSASIYDVFGRLREARYPSQKYTASYTDTGRRLINSWKVAQLNTTNSREVAFPVPEGGVTAFDPLGRERERREIVNGATNPPKLGFSYDLLGRLSGTTRTPGSTSIPNTTFQYDPLGNLLQVTPAAGASGARLSYRTDDQDRICSIAYGTGTPNPTCNVVYDGGGAIKQMPTRANGTRTLTYYANGQVKRVTDGAGNDAQFRYDAFGGLERLELTSNSSPDTRRDRRFSGVIGERDEIVNGAPRKVVTRTIALPGAVATMHGAGTAGDTATWTFAFGEMRGNRFVTDHVGAFVQDMDYRAYGEAVSTGAQPGTQTYTSEQWNGEDALAALGLSNLGARLYDPVIGRFLSRDPLIIPITAANTNPYSFAFNDPVNAADPSGLSAGETKPIVDEETKCEGCAPAPTPNPEIPVVSITVSVPRPETPITILDSRSVPNRGPVSDTIRPGSAAADPFPPFVDLTLNPGSTVGNAGGVVAGGGGAGPLVAVGAGGTYVGALARELRDPNSAASRALLMGKLQRTLDSTLSTLALLDSNARLEELEERERQAHATEDFIKDLIGAKPAFGSSDSDRQFLAENVGLGLAATKRGPRLYRGYARSEPWEMSKDAKGVPRCGYCGRRMTLVPGRPNSFEIDHERGWVRGGRTTIDNAYPTCLTCNRQKGALSRSQFIRKAFISVLTRGRVR